MTESLPIAEYLEETRKDVPLLPTDPFKRLQVRRLCEVINSGVQPITNLSVLKKVETELNGSKEEWAKFYLTEGLKQFENLLTKTKGKYCFGDEVTLADTFLIPQLYNADRFKVDMSLFPQINAVRANLNELDAFKKADANSQPDCTD